jgi:choline dehydrogenase-like flavoprotein
VFAGSHPEEPVPPPELTRAERWLRGLLIGHAVLSALLAIGYVVGGETSVLTNLPNSFAKDVVFVVLSLIAAANVRRFGWLALVLSVAYLALNVGQVVTLLWGGTPDQELLGISVPAWLVLLGWLAIDLVFAVVFFVAWSKAVQSAQRLRYLHPVAFHGLVALAEVVIEGRREAIPAVAVARNVDRYLADLQAAGKSRVQLALLALTFWPVLTGRPPLPALPPDSRKRFLQRRFLDRGATRKLPAPLRPLVRAAIRVASQMAYLGYYGDRRTWGSVGYTPFVQRPRAEPPDDRREPRLRSLPRPPHDGRQEYDTIIVGSGAAGGILAYRLAESGRRVLVLERGPHVDPREFTDDEVQQYLRLYNAGALQLATDFRLQVLQAFCVGGGTTINNGLSLPPPPAVLAEWERAGIDAEGLETAVTEVRRWLEIAPIPLRVTTPAARRFADAVERMQLPGHLLLMEATITPECRGSGYCNIGCAFGAKQSTLDTVLPWGQAAFPGRLDVLADFTVDAILHADGVASAVTGVHEGRERAVIAADEVVVAAGAVGSSALLHRSGLGGDHVGEGLHFNINSPLTADFPYTVDAFQGIQMSHAYSPSDGTPDYLIETWFNPPATQALSMPGWFDRHFENMLRYRHMATVGVLVGTTTPGSVKRTKGDPEIVYTPSPHDRSRLLRGLEQAGRILLEAGADRIMPATTVYQEYRTPNELATLPDRLAASDDLLLTTAHPQGGNAMGRVVDRDFRVTGSENVFVCDASVFPTSVAVNPQLTVMALAQYASGRIAA